MEEDKEDHHQDHDQKKVVLNGLMAPMAMAKQEVEVKPEAEVKKSSDDHETQVSEKQVVVEDKCHDQEKNDDNNNNNVEVGGLEKNGMWWTPWSCEEEQACWMGGDCFHCLISAAAAAHPPYHNIAPHHGEDAAWEVSLWNF